MAVLIPVTGLRSLDRLTGEVDGLWDSFFGGALGGLLKTETFAPSIDVRETGQGFEVTAEVPGLTAEEIKVDLDGELLTISGEKKAEHEASQGGFHVFERRFGSFSRGLRVPKGIDRTNLRASHKDGVLTIVLPLAEKEAPTGVKVEKG